MKSKVIAGIIFVLSGQIVALVIWLLFSKAAFIVMAGGSILGFLASYKDKPNDKKVQTDR